MTAHLPASKCREIWKEMGETVLWDWLVLRADMAGVWSLTSEWSSGGKPRFIQVVGHRILVCFGDFGRLCWQQQGGGQ